MRSTRTAGRRAGFSRTSSRSRRGWTWLGQFSKTPSALPPSSDTDFPDLLRQLEEQIASLLRESHALVQEHPDNDALAAASNALAQSYIYMEDAVRSHRKSHPNL